MKINIDERAGFCWGVVRTVDIAEETLKKAEKGKNTYILGQIIHNPKETERLAAKGLVTINHEQFEEIAEKEENPNVIIRAHGEPPTTYEKADKLGINLVDATCPLVTNLQNRVKKYFDLGYKIVIFGKREHAEVIGLRGVCNDECIVIKTLDEAKQIEDFGKKTALISQTTMDKHVFHQIKDYLNEKTKSLMDLGLIEDSLLARDTTCRAVTTREAPLLEFAKNNDVIIFVSGKNSSNGKSLYNSCKNVNDRSYFIEDCSEIDWNWFDGAETVGISGATSTPQWYMQKVKSEIEKRFEPEPQI
jgi:4-hydroxy-3-methylbut-2-enyl diphosphate reductase